MERRKRRSFNAEYKAEAVRLVREGGKSVPQVAKDLDLTDSALRNWVRQAEVDEGKGPAGALTTDEWSCACRGRCDCVVQSLQSRSTV